MRKGRQHCACPVTTSIKSLVMESFGCQGTSRQQQECIRIKYTMEISLTSSVKMILVLQMQLNIIGDYKGEY